MSCFLPGDRLVERVAQKAFKGEISQRQIFFSSLRRLINRRDKVKWLSSPSTDVYLVEFTLQLVSI